MHLSRIESVDVVRVIAILAVIAIHTTPFETEGAPLGTAFDLATQVNLLARFAVPFFFVVSGFFWGTKIHGGNRIAESSKKMSKRILTIFGAWSLIYLLPFNPATIAEQGSFGFVKIVYWNLSSIANDPIRFLFQGSSVHLWFLIGLLCCVAISAVLVAYNRVNLLIGLSIVLYAIGLFGKAYSDTPLGIHVDFNTRNGPFFGLVFFVSGYVLSSRQPHDSWFTKGLGLLLTGYIVQFAELQFLHDRFGTSLLQDYTIGTYFLGLGSALMALSNVTFLRVRGLGSIGSFVLGIYAIHLIFVDLLRPVNRLTSSPLWEVGNVFAVLILSFLVVYAMSKNRFTRAIVM